MKCSDVDRILPDIIDGTTVDGTRINGDQDPEFQSHLRSCPDCAELVSDLKLIASEARELSNSDEPAPRVWLRIAAELRAEGIIREPEVAAGPALVLAPQRRWSAFWLAPVAVAILVAGSYLLTHKSITPLPPQVAKQAAQSQPEAPSAQLPASQAPVEQAELSPPASADDQEFLSEVSTRAPSMRATYENQLQAVNNEIQETQSYINQNPADADARQHLLEVYQQKAMLYQMALDRIQ